jgi:hypothetical protein
MQSVPITTDVRLLNDSITIFNIIEGWLDNIKSILQSNKTLLIVYNNYTEQ